MPTKLIEIEFDTKYEELRSYPQNLRAKLNLWLPEGDKPVTEIVIMINGFLDGLLEERLNDIYLNRRYFYKFIAEELNKQNVAAILLPLPFHFDRGAGLNNHVEKIFAPLERLKKNGAFLYYGGYDQTKSDIQKLINDVQDNKGKFGLGDSEIKIHLLGYSLGGAAAMGAAAELQQKVASLSVLFSNWEIAGLDPNTLGEAFNWFEFSAADWTRVLSELERVRGSCDPVFQSIMWGDNNLTPWFSTCPQRILFIQGLQDETFPVGMALKNNFEFYTYIKKLNDESASNQSGSKKECVFILPSLPHSHTDLSPSSKKQIAGYIASFVANPGI